jgi:multiple sugar transport system ATP-binding protein
VLVARLSPKSRARAGEQSELWLDSTKLHFFDPQSGEALTYKR